MRSGTQDRLFSSVWPALFDELTPPSFPLLAHRYTIGKSPSPDGSFPLSRFTWTQSIPLEPAKPLHRDCFIFDYATDYTTTIDASRWEAPEGVTCSHRPVAERPGFGEPLEARLASQ